MGGAKPQRGQAQVRRLVRGWKAAMTVAGHRRRAGLDEQPNGTAVSSKSIIQICGSGSDERVPMEGEKIGLAVVCRSWANERVGA